MTYSKLFGYLNIKCKTFWLKILSMSTGIRFPNHNISQSFHKRFNMQLKNHVKFQLFYPFATFAWFYVTRPCVIFAIGFGVYRQGEPTFTFVPRPWLHRERPFPDESSIKHANVVPSFVLRLISSDLLPILHWF